MEELRGTLPRAAMDDAPAGPLRLWRVSDQPGLVLMHSVTASYAVDPNGEYFIGLIGRRGLRVGRGRERHVLRPGDLAVWDPSRAHAGSPLDDGAWECRLIMIELQDLKAIAGDPARAIPDLVFPDPIQRDAELARGFLEMYRALERPGWTLQRQTLVVVWFQRLARRSPLAPREADARRRVRNDPALRRACEFLNDNLAANVTLDALAEAAEVSKFRVVRLFRAGLGIPPHRFQLAQRIRLARRLIERGTTIAETATLTGFFDQSHLHRHFRRVLGMTPGEYATAFEVRPTWESDTMVPAESIVPQVIEQ